MIASLKGAVTFAPAMLSTLSPFSAGPRSAGSMANGTYTALIPWRLNTVENMAGDRD
jgi:hypothetical protein